MLAFIGFLLRSACIGDDPLAIDKLVDMMLASALEVLEGSLEFRCVRCSIQ